MNNTLEQLHSLRLTGMADALSQQLNQPNTYEEPGFLERLSLLVNSESTCRDNRKITRLLKQAKLRLNVQPADIDYRVRRGLNKGFLSKIYGPLAAWVNSQAHDIRRFLRPDRCENHMNFS